MSMNPREVLVLVGDKMITDYALESSGGVPEVLTVEGIPYREGAILRAEITDANGKVWRGQAEAEYTDGERTRFKLRMGPRDNYYHVSICWGNRDAMAAEAAVEILTERYRRWLMEAMEIKTENAANGSVRCAVEVPKREAMRLDLVLAEDDLLKIIEDGEVL